jgi:hypothetical protein
MKIFKDLLIKESNKTGFRPEILEECLQKNLRKPGKFRFYLQQLYEPMQQHNAYFNN